VHLESGQRLAQLVVYLAGDPCPLLFSRFYDVRRKLPQTLLRCAELLFGLLLFGDVPDDRHAIQRLSQITSDQGHRDIRPDRVAVLGETPFFIAAHWHFSGSDSPHRCYR
jgi:hypothetical protein